MEGRVKWYSGSKGYGFITASDGDYFMHRSEILSNADLLREGDEVTFEPQESDRGKKATKVKLKEG